MGMEAPRGAPRTPFSPARVTDRSTLNDGEPGMFLDNLMGLFSTDVAMDLGTANTLVFVKGRGIVLNEPSVVAVDKATGKVRAVGSAAKLMLGRTPDEISAVRPLKDGVISDFELTEDLMRQFIHRVQNHKFLVRPRIIICVPSGITEVEKRAVIDSAERAGAREVMLVPEPIAAAIGVGLPVDTPTGNMVVDIGGGTTEIAVIALNGIVTKTSIRTGGDEMDDAIMNYAKKAYNMLIGEQTAERIKIEIGSAFPLPEEMDMEIKGRDLVRGIPRTLRVSSVEIREALQEPVGQIVNALRECLERTPPELAADIVDRGIFMTGGGALLRGLDLLMREVTNLNIRVAQDPLTCVVLGAGKILEQLEDFDKVILSGHKD
jgi:rod shape-determining protein MreB